MNFDASRKLNLVHQLIRQYVMATILVDILASDKKVVPFVVGGSRRSLQVDFLVKQGWLNPNNVLEWKDVKALRVQSGELINRPRQEQ